jgi:hypothetical protein
MGIDAGFSPYFFAGLNLLTNRGVDIIECGALLSLAGGGPMSRTDTEYVTPELEQLLAIARRELDRHLCDHGTCTRCHQHWPCPTACLAAETLGAL